MMKKKIYIGVVYFTVSCDHPYLVLAAGVCLSCMRFAITQQQKSKLSIYLLKYPWS